MSDIGTVRLLRGSAGGGMSGRALRGVATGLLALLLSIGASRASAAAAPLALQRVMPIPNVPLWLYSDHLAVDLAHERLFATPQGAKAVAVMDLKTGRVLKMIPRMGNPHGLYYSESLSQLFVSDGIPGNVKVFDGKSYALIRTITLGPGADALVYDPHSRLIYVANGDGEKTHHAFISVLDPVRMTKVADIRIATTNFEGMALDPQGQLLYVSLPDDGAVAVIDMRHRRLVETWKLPAGGHQPFAIVLDSASRRLFVACRDDLLSTTMDGTLFVLNTANGLAVATLPIGGWVDGISIDHKRHRVYMSTGVGYIDTYTFGKGDVYEREQRVETDLLGKTSLYSSELDRLYVSVPQVDEGPAKVLVFKPVP